MDKNLEKQLIDRFPTYFRDMYGDKMRTCMHWGCATGNGWYDILYALCEKIELIEDDKTDFRFTQIKEKFGYLTLHYRCETKREEISDLILDAFNLSSKICEECGSAETVETKGRPWWIRTLCGECSK